MKSSRLLRIPVIATAFFLTAAFLPLQGYSDPVPNAKTGKFLTDLNFAGGDQSGYELFQVRWGDHRTFERVVLEFKGGPGTESSGGLPRMEISTEKYPVRIVIRLPGAPDREASIYTLSDPFGKSRMLSGLDIFDLCRGDQSLALIPARPLEYDIFTLEHPARLVIDLQLRHGVPSEQEKYSLRTLPLFGDQLCAFMEAARASGFNPRLLTDRAGNIFGELKLYSSLEDAFRARDQLKKLTEYYSLVIKARGVMEIPATVP